MKVAVIGSRNLRVVNLEGYIPQGNTEIVSGGACGIDACAREYAKAHNLKLTEFLPEYSKYGKAAPLKRNLQIISYVDKVIAFWDGESTDTKHVISNCKKQNKKVTAQYHTVTGKGVAMEEYMGREHLAVLYQSIYIRYNFS